MGKYDNHDAPRDIDVKNKTAYTGDYDHAALDPDPAAIGASHVDLSGHLLRDGHFTHDEGVRSTSRYGYIRSGEEVFRQY